MFSKLSFLSKSFYYNLYIRYGQSSNIGASAQLNILHFNAGTI